MEWVDIQIGLLVALIVVPIWLYKKERDAFLRLFRDWGLRVATPEDEIRMVEDRDLVPDVEVLGARMREVKDGLRVEIDLVARDRLAKKAIVKLGVLDAAGTAFPVPAGERYARFEDAVETPGGEVESSFATVSEMRWEDLGLVVPWASLPGRRIPGRIKLRVEVWVDGKREAAVRRDLEP